MVTNSNQEEPTRKLCIYFVYKKLYKIYTTDVYKMYTKCIQNQKNYTT